MPNAIVGSNGLIGSIFARHLPLADMYNSQNIDHLGQKSYDLVIVTAPSSNRRQADADPQADSSSVDRLIHALAQADIQRLVLIGTVDSQLYPNSAYGANRLRLERAVKQHAHSHVIRLCTLIHSTIKKNILFDLKHNQYLESINPASQLQWYDLNQLINDFNHVLNNDIKDITLVSEPIQNDEIISRFYPGCTLGSNPGALLTYNIQPYTLTKQQIFTAMEQYLNE